MFRILIGRRLTVCSGGMGLTGGFADVGGLYDCLYGIYSGQADESILDLYDKKRREKYLNVIDPISSGNLRRLVRITMGKWASRIPRSPHESSHGSSPYNLSYLSHLLTPGPITFSGIQMSLKMTISSRR